jgi:hypothetical protein
MAKSSLSLPHERRKATLQSQKLRLRVRLAETREGLKKISDELKAMSPKPNTAR